MISEEASRAILERIHGRVPHDHNWIFLAVPVKGRAQDDMTTALTDVPAEKLKELARVLRIVANHYDPQN